MYYYRKIRLSLERGNTPAGNGIIMTTQGRNEVWVIVPGSGGRMADANVRYGNTAPTYPSVLLDNCSHCYSIPVPPLTSLDTAALLVTRGLTPLQGYEAALDGPLMQIGTGGTLDVEAFCAGTQQGEAAHAAEAPAPQTQPQASASAPAPVAATDDISGISVKRGYTQTHTYSGQRCYHGCQSIGFPVHADKPWRIGIELELYARNPAAKQTILGARSNWFQCETDGSLTESIGGVGGLGIEMKTIPLRACDAKNPAFWREPIARLKQLAVSAGHPTTGLHVHIGREIFGDTDTERRKAIGDLNYFYVHVISTDARASAVNSLICGRERGYGADRYPLDEAMSDTLKHLRGIALNGDIAPFIGNLSEDAKSEIRDDLNAKCLSRRWDINTKHLNDYKTVEFRKGDGRISVNRICALVSWWETMVLYAKSTPWAQMNFEEFCRKACEASPQVAVIIGWEDEV